MDRSARLTLAATFVDGLFDPALVLDRELRPVHANAVYRELAGLGLRQMKRALEASEGIGVFRAQGDVDRTCARQCVERRENVRYAEITMRGPNGMEFLAWLAFQPILDDDGEVVGLMEVIRDMTVEASLHRRYREMLEKEQHRASELSRLVAERTQELEQALEQVTRLARTDPLTGLLNRRAFTEHAQQALIAAKRHQRSAAVIMCDLDHFKSLNDTYGHQAGDAVLVATAATIKRCARESDVLGRFGGEEFIILLAETSPGNVADVGERYRAAVAGLPVQELVPAKRTPQTVSIGIALYPAQGGNLEELVRSADNALYKAKESGRNRVCMAG